MWREKRTYSNLLIITLLPLNLSGRDRSIKTTVTFFFSCFFMNTLDDVLKQSGNFHNEFYLRVSTFVTQLSMVFQFHQTLNFYTSAGVQKPAWERWLMPPIELVSSFVMCVPSILLKWRLFSRELCVRDALWIHWLLIVCAGAPLFSSFVMTVGRPLYRLNKITQLFNLATPPSTPIPVSTEALKPQKPAVTLGTPARLTQIVRNKGSSIVKYISFCRVLSWLPALRKITWKIQLISSDIILLYFNYVSQTDIQLNGDEMHTWSWKKDPNNLTSPLKTSQQCFTLLKYQRLLPKAKKCKTCSINPSTCTLFFNTFLSSETSSMKNLLK